MDENKMEKVKYTPQHSPHFPSCIRTDSSESVPLPSFESLQPLQQPLPSAVEGGRALVPPPCPEATPRDNQGRVVPSIWQPGDKAGQNSGFPEVSDWGVAWTHHTQHLCSLPSRGGPSIHVVAPA